MEFNGPVTIHGDLVQEKNVTINVSGNYYASSDTTMADLAKNVSNATADQPQGIDAVRPLLDKVVEAEDDNHRSRLKKVLDKILAEDMFVEAFKVITPNGFKDGYNQKLLLNILGYLHDKKICTLAYDKIKLVVSPDKEVKTYFLNYKVRNTTDSVLTDEMLKKLDALIG